MYQQVKGMVIVHTKAIRKSVKIIRNRTKYDNKTTTKDIRQRETKP